MVQGSVLVPAGATAAAVIMRLLHVHCQRILNPLAFLFKREHRYKPVLMIQGTVAFSSHRTEVKPKTPRTTAGTASLLRFISSTDEQMVLLYLRCVMVLLYIPVGI